MKIKLILIICLSILTFTLSSCDIDPHSNERPVDYPNSVWVCDENDYYFIYYVDDHINNEYQSYFITSATKKTFIKFLWNQYNNGVIVYEIDEKSGQENVLFSGECTFSKNMFQVKVSYVSNIVPKSPDVLIFNRCNNTGDGSVY